MTKGLLMASGQNDLANEKGTTLASGFLYRFGPFALDSRKRTLHRGDTPVSLTARAFDVLLFLAQNPNRLVTKDELLSAVWGDSFVEEGNLTQYIWHIRKALGDNSDETRLIVTIARKGYQFTADVIVDEVSDAPSPPCAQVSLPESLPADPQLVLHQITTEPTSRILTRGRKVAILCVSAVALLPVGLFSWRHSARVMRRGPQKIILAVLPFENLTGDPSKEYLADGLTEQTISQLGRLNPEQLGVIGRTSVMGYKHQNTRLDQIGRDLSVQYVLENSMRESRNRLRLTAQLIQVKDQTHVWSKDYDYPSKDVLTVQDDIAKAISQEIRLRSTSQQQASLTAAHSVTSEAFDSYLQGRYYFDRNTDKDTKIAEEYFEKATQLDPMYAPAWVGLSRTIKWEAVRGLIPREPGYALARRAAKQALSLNPMMADAHTQMGRIQQQIDFDWTGASASFQKAVELEPNNPESLRMSASMAVIRGRFEEGIAMNRRAVEMDPLNAGSWEILGEAEATGGYLDQAVVDLRKALDLDPDLWNGHIYLTKVYIMQKHPQEALQEIERVRFENFRTFLYAIAYSALGRKKEADAALSELMAKDESNSNYLIADVFAFRNQRDEAFQWLDRAFATHNDGLIQIKEDSFLNSLHDDPRFIALLKKLNLPE